LKGTVSIAGRAPNLKRDSAAKNGKSKSASKILLSTLATFVAERVDNPSIKFNENKLHVLAECGSIQ
jgi:hypothetical protein